MDFQNLPIPVLPINFSRIPFPYIIYITIYILSSYSIYKKGFCLETPFLEYWKNWNIGRFWFRLLPTSPEVPTSSRKPRLRLSVITLAANAEQLVGGTLAEVLEGEAL